MQDTAAGEARIARLIADLDADEFAVREKATAELAGLGKAAKNALQQAAADSSSAEVRRRANALLAKLRDDSISPDYLFAMRTIEALEHIATPEAKQLLQQLAAGDSSVGLTREAKAGLERLQK